MKSIIIVLLIILAACRNIPADPGRSLEKAKGTGLLVGWDVNPPWVTSVNDTPAGIEPSILKNFARSEGIKIVWENGPEQALLGKLEEKKLHVVIAGLTKNTPWKSRKIGLSMPYYKEKKTKRVIAVQQGENRLVMEIEKYFLQKKDSINRMINEKSIGF